MDHVSTGLIYTVCKQNWVFWACYFGLCSQEHGYGSRRQRQLRCSCFSEWCRSTGKGCVELVVKETAEEPTGGVQGIFLCVFNAMKHDQVLTLYIWEDVKFQVTFGMLQLSYYKDFWNKQEKKCCLGCVCKYSCLFFWAWGVEVRQRHLLGERPPWKCMEASEPHVETPQLPRCWVKPYGWAEAGGITTGGMCFPCTRWSSVKFCSWVILCFAIK